MQIPEFIIYGLAEKGTGQLRYIGKTSKSLNERLKGHIDSARSKKRANHRNHWIKSQLDLGKIPEIFEIEKHYSNEAANAAEQELIAYYKSLGCRLVNATLGGEGTLGYSRPLRESEKKHLSKVLKGRPKPKGFAEKQRQRMTGSKHSENTKMKLSDHGKMLIADKNPFYGKKHTEETKAILSEKCSKLIPYKRTEAHKKAQFKKKKVQVIETGKVYESVAKASIATNAYKSSVARVCRGEAVTANGYHFKYVKDAE